MIRLERAIDPQTEERFCCIFDTEVCLPVEPIQRYLNYCRKRQLAANTVNTYACRLLDFWQWLEYKSLNWQDVGLEELADFVNWYLLGGEVEVISEEVREIVSKRSPRTVNQAVTAIQGLYEFYIGVNKIDEEKPFTKLVHGRSKRGDFLQGIVKSTPEKRKRIKVKEPKIFPGCLTDEQVSQLANACYSYRDRLIVMLLRETGMRRGELLGLHLIDVQDFDIRGRIRVTRRDNNPNGAIAKGTEREIPILNNRKEVQETFQAYLLEEYPLEAEKLRHGMLFVNLDGKYVGKPMTSVRVNNLFYQLKDRTGIGAHPHLFRHTFATRMLQAGYADHYIQQLLGHSSIATTKNIYFHVLNQMSLNTYFEAEEQE
ncbi:tyrosine-type recombinase/integrase [Nostoc sp. FACHB-888]|uniref:tyrosine-type recombinase/integrase n=1 Tax=Nostoc sp. FACHB-888 TaxID=2692842 RepID=UPI001685FE4A|nr:tyrosine-type recombinase/integrase [Nostoc sp. FACHB-888]MBD2247413.1 tyrosine-type recombinase/integrase [Nostoc sp. FACHB-888]